MLTILLLIAAAYVCGSIPTGVLLSRRHGVDPRDIGSGNIGATNVARAAGRWPAILTLLGDAAKGLVPVVTAIIAGYGEPVIAMVGLAAFLGHLYSCFLGFEGGQGVATALGILIGLAPLASFVAVLVFVVTLTGMRYVSLASIASAAITPVAVFAFGYGAPTVVTSLIVSALVILRHRDNIRRLRFGTEPQIGVKTARSGYIDFA